MPQIARTIVLITLITLILNLLVPPWIAHRGATNSFPEISKNLGYSLVVSPPSVQGILPGSSPKIDFPRLFLQSLAILFIGGTTLLVTWPRSKNAP